ncbi:MULTISPECIES: helix-turn-helix transcriptional regulator [Enterococcus]|uniref:Helix-turn-helix transcriptional regulator n=1 Tax=Enterococcus alishanensis TaxID=1303817 RepID=A0ABS6T8I0_9ENTE|nr:helix-turn-helix transcriptional regulator [Enterococcus alishanensis]MBV7389200.1 helix-turn-helix transcriptional regulator [Enterococcus alishanensis]
MNLSERQEKIIAIVKKEQPLSGEKIAEHLGISHATLRTDLSFLTMAGILEASPKVGYTYTGVGIEQFLFDKIFSVKVGEIMLSPLLTPQDTSIHDAITNMFMYDVGSIYVTDENKKLVGLLSRKDLLRAALNSNLQSTPVAVVMTRAPHVRTCTKDFTILEAGAVLLDYQVDSLPVVDETDSKQIVGKITKSRIFNYIMQQARQTETNR